MICLLAKNSLCTCSCFDLRDSVSRRELAECSSVETRKLTRRYSFIRGGIVAKPLGGIGGIDSMSHANFQLAVRHHCAANHPQIWDLKPNKRF